MERSLKRKGFRALLITQFLGAFNDNAFKLVIALAAIDKYADKAGGTKYLSLAGMALIVPFLLFSTYAGFLADRFSKQVIIIKAKIAELLIMLAGLAALMSGNIVVMLGVLFLMGAQSAFFSPSKYGILPEILDDDDLSAGNGIMQMWTNAAIILGTAAGGYIFYITKPRVYEASYLFIVIALLGMMSSFFVAKVNPAGSKRKFEFNFLKEVYRNIKEIKSERVIFLSILGLVYFGFLGALFQLNILLYARNIMAANDMLTSIFLVILAGGIGAGSVLAGKFSDKKIELGLVPLGAIGLTLFSFILGCSRIFSANVIVSLFLLGVSAGFYIVPLNALIQQKAPADKKGQVLAVNNFLSFIAMLIGSGAVYVFRDILSLDPAQILILSAFITIAGTAYIVNLLPYALVRFVLWILTHTIYSVKAVDKENIPREGGALLVANHVSVIDGLLVAMSIQRPVRFLVNRKIYESSKVLNALLKLAKAIPISTSDSPRQMIEALGQARQAILDGEVVCIFAEGQLTRTGNMLKFKKGVEHILRGISCPVIPVNLDRIWGSIFSFERGRYYYKIPKLIPYPVTISFGNHMSSESSAFEIRRQIMELGAEAFRHRLADKMTLPQAFRRKARSNFFKFCVADYSGRKLTFGAMLILCSAAADKLKKILSCEKNVGILLPPSIAGVVSNVAVATLNKVSVNLNYTLPEEAMEDIVKQCRIKHIITSKAFAEKLNVSLFCEKIFIEDVMFRISAIDKFKAAVKSFLWPDFIFRFFSSRRNNNSSIEDLATIMFTSGSTGKPKGVMLTHANITANLEGLYQVFHTKDSDKLMGVLPLFHSFGFTATLWFPLISGIGCVYHFNPLDAKAVGAMVEKHKATILMSTPTFLNAYVRSCAKEQFESLRQVIVGAEKLKAETAEAFKEKFGIDPMEGYGCTELSPIVSVNFPDYTAKGTPQKAYKQGTIGLPLPGVAVKILHCDTKEPVDANEEGLLFIKGASVMKGYLNRPEETEKAIQDGWYATGDMASMDEDGFLKITGRLSRFSKIAGEMVPHIKIEEAMHEALNSFEQICAVTSVPDDKKGEKLVVVCLKQIDARFLIQKLRKKGLPNLWIPDESSFYKVDALPILGSGKIDLGTINQIAAKAYCET
ncbi:MAG: acyl-[ACP]--phospholipid O-acyltransferase [Candidatus Omnitrophota bacterium]